MSVWCARGRTSFRCDGMRLFGRPPVLAPPAWALAEQVWRGIGVAPAKGETRGAEEFARLRESIPPQARRVVLVVPDGTRVGPWREVLGDVMAAVRAGAPAAARLRLLVAGGVHAGQDPDRLAGHLFPSAAGSSNPLEGWSVIQNCDKAFREHVLVGTTPGGTPVRLHPEYVHADYRVVLGEISWHYFAGFGGGRKLVFPGLGDPVGVAANHRRAVRFPEGADAAKASLEAFGWHAGCRPGRLDGNPVHEDLVAAVALRPPDWVVTVVEEPPADPDPSRPICFASSIVQGTYPAAFEEASARFDRAHRIPLTLAPVALVADAGGAPRDSSFLQAHKSLQHALRFLGPGGRLLLVAECGDGLGSPMLSRFASDPRGFRPSVGPGGDPMAVVHIQTLVALRRAVASAQVGLWSELPEEAVRALGMRPFATRDEALAWVSEESGVAWGWLPRAERFLPARIWAGGCLP